MHSAVQCKEFTSLESTDNSLSFYLIYLYRNYKIWNSSSLYLTRILTQFYFILFYSIIL